MTQLFRYVNRKQLTHDQVQTIDREPCRKRIRLKQNSTSMKLSNRSNVDHLHINSDHEKSIANENTTDDEKIYSSISDNSTINNTTSCTSHSTRAQEVYSDQEHSYQVDIETDSLMMIDESRHSYCLTSAFSDQSNNMFSYLKSLTLS